MKKISLVLVIVLCLTLLGGCGKKEAAQSVGMPNPIKEVTAEELLEATGIALDAPEGAADVKYRTIAAEPVTAEIIFTLDGKEYCYRAVSTSETAAADISGMYGDAEESNVSVSYCDAVLRQGKDFTVVYWLDVVPGLNYSLSNNDGASAEDVLAVAELCFVPAQMAR